MSESNCDMVQYIDSSVFYMQGKLVYANQGKMSDFELLNTTLDLRGAIAIIRYGGEGRSEKVRKHYINLSKTPEKENAVLGISLED